MCPDFGIDSVLKRPDCDTATEITVPPGAHGFGAGQTAYSVVWWDPKALDLGKTPSFSIRQQELLEKGSDSVVKKCLSEYQAWSVARAELLGRGAVPNVRFQTATERSRSEIPFVADVEVIETAKEARPHGPRFGTLVHSTLASVPLDAEEAEVAATAELQGRIVGAKDEEVKSAIVAVTAALQQPLIQRARAASEKGHCYRELPLTLRMEDGTLIEGIADLVFREDGRWIVVDFKTDQELARELVRYRRQVSSRCFAPSIKGAA
jgi:ATP-dependent exoDNAse (exonuclease V) beta subunit